MTHAFQTEIIKKNVIFWLVIALSSIVTSYDVQGMELTESKVFQMALEQNLGVKIAETDAAISETGIQGSQSVFDTFLEWNAEFGANALQVRDGE